MNDTYTFHDARLQEAAEQGWIGLDDAKRIDVASKEIGEGGFVIYTEPSPFAQGVYGWSSVEALLRTVSSWPEANDRTISCMALNPGKPIIQTGWKAEVRSDGSFAVKPKQEVHIWPEVLGDDCYGISERLPDGSYCSVQFSDESADHALKLARERLAEEMSKEASE